ncbi:MAG: hypothetical protein ACI95C_002364 [Pseudohongiellaceae bacterium]|jgi:hypothetical protein
MKKTVWICCGVALVLVNVIAEVGYYYTGIYIDMLLRVSLVFGITMGVTILISSINLVQNLDKEVPLSGNVKDTLGPDRRK